MRKRKKKEEQKKDEKEAPENRSRERAEAMMDAWLEASEKEARRSPALETLIPCTVHTPVRFGTRANIDIISKRGRFFLLSILKESLYVKI